MTINDDNGPKPRKIDPSAQTVELDAKVLRKLVVSTILDLGDESGSVPVRVTPPPAVDDDAAPAKPAVAGDPPAADGDDKRV